MEKNLKLKFEYRGLKLELEGDENTVKNLFDKAKTEGFGDIIDKIDRAESFFKMAEAKIAHSKEHSKQITDKPIIDGDYPPLNQVLMKGYPSSETDWILVYVFYASNFGTKIVSKSEISDKYKETKRETTSTKANLSKNIKSLCSKDFLNAINNDEFSLTEDGIKEAEQIILGKKKSVSKKKKSPSSEKTKVNQTYHPKIVPDLDLKPKDKMILKDFFSQYELSSFSDKILVIVYYMKEILKIDKVGPDYIYTGLRDVNEKSPNAFKQAILDTKSKKGWIQYESIDDINLTMPGRNHLEHEIPKVKK